MIIGVDMGGSYTKIVSMREGKIDNVSINKASIPLEENLKSFINSNNINIKNIKKIVLTGTGSATINESVCKLETVKADEFICNRLGTKYFISLDEFLIVCMGTGTSFTRVKGEEAEHLGGTGIGGGTLVGLSNLLLNTTDINLISELAAKGNLSKVDLQIRDISEEPYGNLPLDITLSNFGKINKEANNEDLALGLINMILQCIGRMAMFSVQNCNIKDFVLIGRLASLPQCNEIFRLFEELFNIKFYIPEHNEYITAIGAALAFNGRKNSIDML